MNLGNGQFADVSAISQFDFPDDGRGMALVDWDQDGDQDVWLSNRNTPQVRFLMNQSNATNRSLAITLQGTDSNRDAIGARVQVFVGDNMNRPITRTMRAGNGFLSQSSKRLVFGLGQATKIDRLVVNWPSGKSQTYQIPVVDSEYRIIEGNTEAILVKQRPAVNIAKGALPTTQNSDVSHSLRFAMVRLPAKNYSDFRDDRHPILKHRKRLVLLTLWASWCQPCIKELQEFTAQQEQLEHERIDVVALSVDDITDMSVEPGTDERLLKKIGFPFRTGKADSALVQKLQLLNNHIFELQTPLPIPTSFLLDRNGRVIGIYKGPVSVNQLMEDSGKTRAKTTNEWRQATLPFPGNWVMPPRVRDLFGYVQQLADHGYFEECVMYVQHNREMITGNPGWPALSRKLQKGLEKQQSPHD